jgi:hypothetical protein
MSIAQHVETNGHAPRCRRGASCGGLAGTSNRNAMRVSVSMKDFSAVSDRVYSSTILIEATSSIANWRLRAGLKTSPPLLRRDEQSICPAPCVDALSHNVARGCACGYVSLRVFVPSPISARQHTYFEIQYWFSTTEAFPDCGFGVPGEIRLARAAVDLSL